MALPKLADLEKLDEEFGNFMIKVNQVGDIVRKLSSGDENLREIGDVEARQYLGEDRNLDNVTEDVELVVRNDRTVINKKAILKNDNPEKQSQEVFMEEMSKDADRRYRDKLVRKERMETLKKQANLAFKRQEFEKSLSLYTKAIDLIKDSCQLYLNRALTCMHLKLFEKSIADCKTALRLNEDSLKGWLLLAKCHFLNGDLDESKKAIDEAKTRNRGDVDFIDDYVRQLSL